MICRTIGPSGIDADVQLSVEGLKGSGGETKERACGGIDLLIGLKGEGRDPTITAKGELEWLGHVRRGPCFFDRPNSDTG